MARTGQWRSPAASLVEQVRYLHNIPPVFLLLKPTHFPLFSTNEWFNSEWLCLTKLQLSWKWQWYEALCCSLKCLLMCQQIKIAYARRRFWICNFLAFESENYLHLLPPSLHLKPVSSSLFLNIISKSCHLPMSPCQPGMWNRVTLPQCSPEWELGHCGTKEEKGAYGLETTPPPWSVKHSSPNMAQGSYPHWSAGNGSSPRQCPSPPACSLLNWPSMQWVARVEESACWIEGSACRRQVFVCFCYNQPLLSSEELIPPPSPPKCGSWSLTPILM